MIRFLFWLMSLLPLNWLYALGGWGGRMVYRLDRQYAQRLAENATQAGYDAPDFWLNNSAESGRGGVELAYLWSDEVKKLLPNVKVTGWEAVERLHAQGRGMVMLTPHMGAFEVLSLWIGLRVPYLGQAVVGVQDRSSFLALCMAGKRLAAAVDAAARAGHHLYKIIPDFAGLDLLN